MSADRKTQNQNFFSEYTFEEVKQKARELLALGLFDCRN